MSNSRPPNFDKAEMSGSTIGFRFHANEEELEEVQSKEENPDVKEENVYLKLMTDILKPEVLDGGKVVPSTKDTIADSMKEQKSILGKRSVSVDSASESHFSNPIERWKKFSEFKEKITKTVEEKISEMKIDRNVLGKAKLIHSKDNSSISDSEDTSESSKMSEQCKDIENQTLGLDKTSNESSNAVLNTSVSDVRKETESSEDDNRLRNRKSLSKFSELVSLPHIKIAVAKNADKPGLPVNELNEFVESGVEADETFNEEGSESLDFFDTDPVTSGGAGSNNNPLDGKFGSGVVVAILSQTKTVVFIVLFCLYLLVPLPEFFKGCILSFLLMIFWGTVKGYVQYEDSLQHQPFIIDYRSLPPLRVPKSEVSKGVWFNEYEQDVYDPDYYSVTHTVPVYLELEGSVLKISRAKGKIRRRATYDEPEYKLPIIGKRVFNIKGCSIYLLPEGLTRKRLFSKKYPIVIFLKRDALISETRNGKEVEEKELLECFEGENTDTVKPVSPKNKCTLFLFARCDRQKEEWYRKLLAATKVSTPDSQTNFRKLPEPCQVQTEEIREEEYVEKNLSDESPSKEPTTPFENICFIDEDALLDEYFHYMASFASVKRSLGAESGEVKEEEQEDDSCNPHLQWFNAFVNRILFDVFRSPYWLAKIQEKVQRKMNSIRMPYYVEDIEVIEMDLGKTGPMFHRVSPPYIDDRGLWFDMDLTFNGLIRLTIQTQLNLIKLQKGCEEMEAATASTAAVPSATSTSIAGHLSEKPKKGKKAEKSEKDLPKSNFDPQASTETSKNVVKNIPSGLSGQSPSDDAIIISEKAGQEIDYRMSDDYTDKLIHEVSRFAEIAVEEGIAGGKEKVTEKGSSCPCTKREKNSSDYPSCACTETIKNRSPIYDSELEDSAESSSEEEEDAEEHHTRPPSNEEPRTPMGKRYPRNRRSSKKIFKVFENVAQSKYFKSVAQSKYVQKAIAGVSAAKLRLTLEIKSCTGVLVINIPPPPSDRFWYGFREMPTLIFSANPKIGDKAVRFIHIKSYLQKKILYELKKVMVAPNMIDFVLPTSAPQRSPSFVQVEESDMQEGTFSE